MDLSGRTSDDEDVEPFSREPAAQRSFKALVGPDAIGNLLLQITSG